MASMLQSNPSNARDAIVQPDWNSKNGNGVSVPSNRNATRELDDVYDSARNGEKQRLGVESTRIAAPTIASLSPATGAAAGGTVVTITGNNLTGATSAAFGGTAGTVFTKVSDNVVKVTSPAKTAGVYTVTVVTGHGTATKTTAYTYS